MDKEELAAAASATKNDGDVLEGTGNEVEGNGNGSGRVDDIQSLIDQVADLRAEAKSKDHHLDLPIPGTKDLLWARFRPFPAAKTERKANEYQQSQRRGRAVVLTAACDTLIDACEQIMLLKPQFDGDIGEDGKNLIPIDDTVPIGFEERLVRLFVKDDYERSGIKTARDVVMAMFPTEQAIITMNVEVSRWMNDVTKKSDGDFLRD